jgi:hypothetical protein
MWRPRVRSLQASSGWLTLLGAVGLFASLFLSWSHQLPASVLAVAGGSPALRGVRRDPTAWQVYSIVDVLLALLSGALVAVALAGRSRRGRVTMLIVGGIAFAFVVHGLSTPPTNGVLVLNPVASSPQYLHGAATSGPGEVVALVALIVGGAGLALSLATD